MIPARLWRRIRRQWRLAVVAGSYLAATVAVALLLNRFPGQWFAATQITTSLLLLVITWWYVRLTGRMVAVQERAPRQQLQLQAAARVIRESLKANLDLPILSVPLDTSKGKPRTDWGKVAELLIDFQVGVIEQLGLLLDTNLRAPIIDVARLANRTASRATALAQVLAMEETAAKATDRGWSWEEAKRWFNADVRPGMLDQHRCEWDELIQGKYIHELADALSNLQNHASVVALHDLSR
jgi:hypothetical protein